MTRITLYSGGVPVREWFVLGGVEVMSNGTCEFLSEDSLITVSGTFFVQEEK